MKSQLFSKITMSGTALVAVFGILGVLSPAGAMATEVYDLRSGKPNPVPVQVTVTLNVGGHLLVAGEKQTERIPMSVVAQFRYDEQRLDDGSEPTHRMALRHYDQVDAVIKVENEMSKPTLRESRRLVCSALGENGINLSASGGPLTREELDILEIPGNTLILDEILPQESVAVGHRWKLTDKTLCRLLGLDAVAHTETEGQLVEVKGDVAEILLEGPLSGAAHGVAVQIELKGKLLFDLRQKAPQSLILAVKENRGVGHVAPGLDVVAKVKVDLVPQAESKLLTSEVVQSAELPKSDEPQPLEYRDDARGYRFTYDRRWHITREEPYLVVLRLMERGDLIAQCNVMPAMQNLEKPVQLVQFQNDVQAALGKMFNRFERGAERTTPSGLRLLDSVVIGTANELPIQWRYYLVHNQQGRAMTMVFTMETPFVEQFGDQDKAIVESIEFLEPKLAAKPE